jgi:hypothetical protein
MNKGTVYHNNIIFSKTQVEIMFNFIYAVCMLNVHWAGGVRQTEMHTAEAFVPERSAAEVEVAVGKLKSYKSPGFDQISAELFSRRGSIAFGDS